jgi:hypothetical protein
VSGGQQTGFEYYMGLAQNDTKSETRFLVQAVLFGHWWKVEGQWGYRQKAYLDLKFNSLMLREINN